MEDKLLTAVRWSGNACLRSTYQIVGRGIRCRHDVNGNGTCQDEIIQMHTNNREVQMGESLIRADVADVKSVLQRIRLRADIMTSRHVDDFDIRLRHAPGRKSNFADVDGRITI